MGSRYTGTEENLVQQLLAVLNGNLQLVFANFISLGRTFVHCLQHMLWNRGIDIQLVQ